MGQGYRGPKGGVGAAEGALRFLCSDSSSWMDQKYWAILSSNVNPGELLKCVTLVGL